MEFIGPEMIPTFLKDLCVEEKIMVPKDDRVIELGPVDMSVTFPRKNDFADTIR